MPEKSWVGSGVLPASQRRVKPGVSHSIQPVAHPTNERALRHHWTPRRTCFDALNSALRPIRAVGQPARVVATAIVGPICPVPMIATRETGSLVMVSSQKAGRDAPCRGNRCLTDYTARCTVWRCAGSAAVRSQPRREAMGWTQDGALTEVRPVWFCCRLTRHAP